MRRLGIDLGTVRTGLAVADSDVRVATPLRTLEYKQMRELIAALVELIASEQIAEAVVGLPLELSGREGDAARRARSFATQLAERAKVPVQLWDERLSTASAERSLRSQGVRGQSRRRMIDQVAATVLLQGYLDASAHADHEAHDAEHPAHDHDHDSNRPRSQ
jgi:putative Holliday junction resolvase